MLSFQAILKFSQKKIEDAAEARMQAQGHMEYYKKKLDEEASKLAKAEQLAADTQKEFEVRV